MKTIDSLCAELEEARAEVDRLRAALATYADPANWDGLGGGGEEWVWDGDDRAGWALARDTLAEGAESAQDGPGAHETSEGV